MRRTKIIHIITGLNTGGAEMMLYKLLSEIDHKKYDSEVISLLGEGAIGKRIQGLGISVKYLGMNPNRPNPLSFFWLCWWLRKSKPDLIQTWMYHADLLGGIAIKLIKPFVPVIWGIRVASLDPELSTKRTRLIVRVSAFLSRWIPRKVVCNAESARKNHVVLGYQEKKMMVIPNGFDLSSFRPDSEARRSFREEISISEDAMLVGTVARFDPQKDYGTLFRAVELVLRKNRNVRFVACGRGVEGNQEMNKLIRDATAGENCHLVDERNDIPRIMASLDVFVLSSAYGEGFPNVIGEAMACGVPCVATDVGDSALIVGDTGIVVSPRNPEMLADGIRQLLELTREEREGMGIRARERIKTHYALEHIVKLYENLYREEI